MSGLVKDGELRRWFRTTDVKANACEVIHKVELAPSETGDVNDMDLTSSSLEEMFQIHPSVVSGRFCFGLAGWLWRCFVFTSAF